MFIDNNTPPEVAAAYVDAARAKFMAVAESGDTAAALDAWDAYRVAAHDTGLDSGPDWITASNVLIATTTV